MALTGGKGIDVVLNSLAGEAITRGLQILRPFGRFLEIGKRDLYGNSRIGLRPFRQNLSYFGIDADTLLIERPDLAARLFAEITALFADGTLRPLPYQAFPLERAGEAFRLMQASRHVGKIVLTVPETLRAVADVTQGPATGGTWVVSGGLSGFGLASARWLAEQGVTHLALLGRRGAETDEAQAALAWFAEADVTVMPLACDVADRASLGAALDAVRAQLPPIVGVLHAAAVIEDAPVIMIEREQAHRVQGAKIQGAWNFHELTQDDPIAAFVLYSSSAAVVGNPGQGIYVGANLFLDALAQLRRAQGRPALSVAWGAIKGAGFLTRNAQVEDMLASRAGMGATPYRDALREIGHLLAIGANRVAASQFNLMRLGQALPATRRPRFEKLVPQGVSVAADGGGEWAEALAAMNEDERAEVLTTLVREKVAQVIGAAASQIEIDKPLAELGLDSLMAVELAEALEADIGKPISVMQMIQAGSVGGVVTLVQRAFRPVDAVDGPAAAAAVRDAA
jgi:NAD(P)-dependent dehydrogenase (short-subunit alcohol dehydrogenase family)/acyl carrier protein